MGIAASSWSWFFLCSFVVYVAIRHVYQKRTAANEHEVRRIDTTERILLTIVLLGSLLLPVLYLFTPLLRFADYRLPAVLPWIGSGAQLVALWLFWRSHADLGVNWSISLEVRSGHQLVTHGVYRRVRHPMYSAMWLWSVAQAMLLQNWLAGCGALVTFAPLYWIRTPREERMMREAFGLDYDNYVARTGRLWPRLFRRQRDQ